MDKILCDQFIYGKFGQGEEGQGYQITACSSNLQDIKLDDVLIDYKFWQKQPNKLDHFEAIGIFPSSENINPYRGTKCLIIAQLQLPSEVEGNGLKRRTVKRPFYQYRYVFVKKTELSTFRYKIFELLLWLFTQPIPPQEQKQLWPKSIPLIPSLEVELTKEFLSSNKETAIKNIKGFIEQHDSRDLQIILKAISALISNYHNSNSRLAFWTTEEAQGNVSDYIQCIYLLLPAIYRSQISLVMGYISEKNCKQAKIMVSIINRQTYSLPTGCTWLNDEHTIYSNLEEFAQVPELDYVKALDKFFSKRPDENQIRKLVDELDDERLDKPLTDAGATLPTLLEYPSLVLKEIPSLSSNRDAVLIGLKRQQYSPKLAELAPRIDRVCNLNRDHWEDIESLLNQLSKDGTLNTVLNFLEVLLNQKVWDSPEAKKLEKLKKLKENSQRLSLAELINYTQNEPDEWKNLQPIAETAFHNSNLESLKFIDLTLGCSKKWCDKFSLQVLYNWLSLAAKDPALLNHFIQETTFAWQLVFQANPDQYIDKLLKALTDQTDQKNIEPIIKVLIKCLPKLPVDNSELPRARTKILQYVMDSPNFSDLVFKLFRSEFFPPLSEHEWELLSQKIFDFPEKLVDSIRGYLILIKFPIDSKKEKYKKYSIESAQKFAKTSITDGDKAGVFLETCQKLWFNKEELIEIVKIIIHQALSPSSENGSSIIEALFLQLSAWKLHQEQKLRLDKEEILDITKTIIDKALSLSPEKGSSIIDTLFSQLLAWKLHEEQKEEILDITKTIIEKAPSLSSEKGSSIIDTLFSQLLAWKFHEDLLKEEKTRRSKKFIDFLELLPQARTKVQQLNNSFFVGLLYQLLLNENYYQYLKTWRDSPTDDDPKRCYESDFKEVCFKFVERHEQTEVDKYVNALSEAELKEESQHLRETYDSYIGKKSPEEQQGPQELLKKKNEPDSSPETQPEIPQETDRQKLEKLETKVETFVSSIRSEILELKQKLIGGGGEASKTTVKNTKDSQPTGSSENTTEIEKKNHQDRESNPEETNERLSERRVLAVQHLETPDESDELFPTFKLMVTHFIKILATKIF